MNNNGDNIIEELRRRVEQDAQRKSQKIKCENVLNGKNNYQQLENKISPLNIFANLKKPEKVNLFEGERKSVNLFQMKPKSDDNNPNAGNQARNIFNNQQQPIIKNQTEDEKQQQLEEGSPGDKSQQMFKTEPDVKEMKYEYKTELVKILELKVKKFKAGNSFPQQQVYLTLQKLESQPSSLYLVVRSNTTKVITYQGILIKNISCPEHFMEKSQNVRFQAIKKNLKKGEDNKDNNEKRLIKEFVKIQFFGEEDGKKFISVAQQYFGGEQN